MKYLTAEGHRRVVEQLVELMKSADRCHYHEAGPEYTSLLICFMMHSKGAAESLLALHQKWGPEWFPATACYVVVRSLFEIDVTAHYLSKDPSDRAKRYIAFEHILKKKRLDAVDRHRKSRSASWQEGMELAWTHEWAPMADEINQKYRAALPTFPTDRNGRPASTWSGKSLYQMAKEVDHTEAYDTFYADLSSFTHVNVEMANRFLRLGDGEATWTQRASEFDVGSVFRYAAIFLSCFLEFFGQEMKVWQREAVTSCWDVPSE